jgi:hypothetical protein
VREAKGRLDRDEHGICVQGLLQEVQRADAHRSNRRVDCRVPAHHDYRRLVLGGPHAFEELHAVPVGEGHVEQAHVVRSLLQLFFRYRHSPGDVDTVAFERKRLLERCENRRFVVDDEQVGAGHIPPV